MCVFITAVLIIKLFVIVCVCVCVCVLLTAVPMIKLFTWGRGIVEDMCYERRRAEACVD